MGRSWLLAIVIGTVLATPAMPVAAAPGATLTLSPEHGDSTSQFAATFRSKGRHGCGGTVTFTWDDDVTLATRPLDSDCAAQVDGLTPPPGTDRVGRHVVMARHVTGDNEESAEATYTIDRAGATPLPTPSVVVTLQPTAPASCDTRVARALGGDAFMEVPGVAGGVTDPQHPGAMAIRRLGPSAMLPPSIGTVPLAQVAVTRVTDQGSPALHQAADQQRRMSCVHVELGASSQYVYAIYAFREAVIASVQGGNGSPSEETATVGYASVRWEYQLRDRQGNPAEIVTGGGDIGQAPLAARAAATASSPPILLIVLSVLGLLGAAVPVFVLMRNGRLRLS